MNNKSVVLIGMPGCGKSTLGSILAKKLSYEFIDMDNFIEDYSGKKISELFSISEDHFRNIESEVCEILGKRKNVVIASGGGIVKRKENINSLEDTTIIYLDRDLNNIFNDIKIEDRPLLKDNKARLFDLYNERYELYKSYSEFRADNNSSIEDTINNILDYLKKRD